MQQQNQAVLILDFGSQYTQLIARRTRELKVFSEVLPFDVSLDRIRARNPIGLILSGGPESVYDEHAPVVEDAVFSLGIPVLGICYGMQFMMHRLGGSVEAGHGEYGRAQARVQAEGSALFTGLERDQQVWASHGDRVLSAAPGFVQTAESDGAPFTAVEDRERSLYGLQFHPEVHHTDQGTAILRNFLYGVCGAEGDWSLASFVDQAIREVQDQVGDAHVICGLSGGVDSSVMALLLHRALGDALTCIFVNNGVLRKGEVDEVIHRFREDYHLDVRLADSGEMFLSRLAGVTEPEKKRKIIGQTFIEVFEQEAARIDNATFLAQGTIYPDRIESASVKGPSATIKTHHNVGGLPDRMNLSLVEPLRDLFKDEVREVGRELGLSAAFVGRHPFPGPGLAVRILGEVTAERVAVLQEADAIFISELRAAGLYDSTAQAFVVLLPVKTVGVMGDQRTYESVAAIRVVTTTDFMTADWARLPDEFLALVANRIVNEVRGINRVVYDITSKPPGTIEWE
ncbi:MAG: glutamine-hydrolyzing GMP synthase [Acidobacteria bacterium]|uniref:GMP synthase [glutamine-hydrolyzing] n=1 Tax=Candidatus Polarisedimenticola svalbardensis TaxID=2886004 RepID=A0A8J6XYH6_9BACT|nr:glutamine-hydrolyzing GMP synthase [Candidatus Polarisedimenticola svalbardensis]